MWKLLTQPICAKPQEMPLFTNVSDWRPDSQAPKAPRIARCRGFFFGRAPAPGGTASRGIFRGREGWSGVAVRFGAPIDNHCLKSAFDTRIQTMAKAVIVEEQQFDHAVKVARVTGRNRARDVALLHVLFGTALTPTEIALLRVEDYLDKHGQVRAEWKIREEIAFNGKERPLFWVNKKVIKSIDAYLEERLHQGLGLGKPTSTFRGLKADSALFLTEDGRSMAMTKRVVEGREYFACDVLTAIYKRLFAQAGIEGASATSGRRTFATKLYRQRYDLRHIQELLGHSSISVVKKLVEEDPVSLGSLVAKAI